MIKTIIFDLAEVIITGFYGIEDDLKNHLKLPPLEIKTKLQGPEFRLLMEDKINEDEFWKKVIERNNWQIQINVFKEAIRNNFKEIPGTKDIIKKLRKEDLKIALLSDHSREWINYCENKFNYQKLFHYTQYSFEVQCCKTDKRTFEILLKKMKEKSKHCLFIDDSKQNIKIARSIGLNTILFQDQEQLKKDLSSFLVKI